MKKENIELWKKVCNENHKQNKELIKLLKISKNCKANLFELCLLHHNISSLMTAFICLYSRENNCNEEDLKGLKECLDFWIEQKNNLMESNSWK